MTVAGPDEPLGDALRRHLLSVDRVIAHAVSVRRVLRLLRAVAEGLNLGVVEALTLISKPLSIRP